MLGLDFLFGCTHNRTSLPITMRNKSRAVGLPADQPSETYIVCLECGKKFPYSWEKMKVMSVRRTPRREAADPHGVFGWFSRHRWSSRGT